MKPNFMRETIGANNYLVCKIAGNDLNGTVLGVLMANRSIGGLIPVTYTQTGGEKILKYNVAGMETVKKLLDEPLAANQLVSILLGVAAALSCIEYYMIELSNFIFNLDCIFVEPNSFKALMLCVPTDVSEKTHQDIAPFMRSIVEKAKLKDSKEAPILESIATWLDTPKLSLQQMKAYLEKLAPMPQRAAPQMGNRQEVKPQPDRQEHRPIVSSHRKQQSHSTHLPQIKVSLHNDESDTIMDLPQRSSSMGDEDTIIDEDATIMDDSSYFNNDSATIMDDLYTVMDDPYTHMDETYTMKNESHAIRDESATVMDESATVMDESATVMDESATVMDDYGGYHKHAFSRRAILVSIENGAKIPVNKDVFSIGRSKSSDLTLENDFVSRLHCRVLNKGGRYAIVDMDSKNHTYLNGAMLESKVEVPLTSGTRIQVADEVFEFRVE